MASHARRIGPRQCLDLSPLPMLFLRRDAKPLCRNGGLVTKAGEIEHALTGAIAKRMLEGSGKLHEVKSIDDVLQVTFTGVTDDAHVFDTLSGALLDLRIELGVVPELDVKIRRK